MRTSSIGWTDFSGGAANFVMRGSTPGDCEVSAGCANCYVLRMPFVGRWLPECTTWYPERLRRLERTRFPAFSPKRGAPHKPMVFPCDTGDLFHPSVPEVFIAEALDVMAAREDVIWQVLTKRPERLRHMVWWLGECWPGDSPFNLASEVGRWPDNIWFGVSVETQATADQRIPILLDTPAAVRFVSVEPMLGPVDLHFYNMFCDRTPCGPPHPIWEPRGGWGLACRAPIHWTIVGAESGRRRRPFQVEWALDVYEQCQVAGVAFFGKQDGGAGPGVPLELPGYGVVREWPATVDGEGPF